MSVVGIDFGNFSSVIAVARNRGVDIICNEVSNRNTPSLVGFGDKSRYIGEMAKTNEMRNLKSTVGSLKRFIGVDLNSKDFKELEENFFTCKLAVEEGQVGAVVVFQGEEKFFTAVQLIAMFFGKLKETTERELGHAVSYAVISCPGYYTDAQKKMLLDASKIAGLDCLRLLNDETAAALSYGITKTDLPEEGGKNVCIVDIGHASFKIAIANFKKGKLEMKGKAFDRHFGGRNFDEVLVDHFTEKIQEKFKVNVRENPKSLYRVRLACERLKKMLSANYEAMINIESVTEDRDFSQKFNRDEFEALFKDLLARMDAPLEQVLASSGLKKSEIDSIELIGGGTRIPAIKEKIKNFFEKDVSFTLNQDESIARGCALMCAMLSPVFRVREFAVTDINIYPVTMKWRPTVEDPSDKEAVVFGLGNTFPCTKMLTFYRKEDFDIDVMYENANIPEGISTHIGKYRISKVTPNKNGGLSAIKVKVRLNEHGLVSVESGHMIEEVIETVEEKMDVEKEEFKDASQNPEDIKEEEKPVKTKKSIKKTELDIVGQGSELEKSTLALLSEGELSLIANDRLVAVTAEKKNELEEYIYNIRSKLEGECAEFMETKEKEKFMSSLVENEDWLYGDGEDAIKSMYVDRIAALKKVGVPVEERFIESQNRPRAESQLLEVIAGFMTLAKSDDEKLSHITIEERTKVISECETVSKWLSNELAKQEKLAKYVAPSITSAVINGKKDYLLGICTPIVSRPKPEPKKEEVEVKKDAEPAKEAPADIPVATGDNMDVD